MDIQLLLTFIGLNILNVIVQTAKSIITVKSGKTVAAIVNAVAYGLYTIVTIYLLSDLPLLWKALIVALCNLVGVYVVKWIEEKARKDKLWLVKITVPAAEFQSIKNALNGYDIPFTFYDVTKYIVFDTYCNTQKETNLVTDLCKKHNGKAFAAENKLY